MSGLRVLIVDDHEPFRTAAATLLTTWGFQVVGGVADGASTVAAVKACRPDLVLLDVQLPDVDGIAVAHLIDALPDSPQVILVSSRDDAADDVRVRTAPVRGFLAKRHLDHGAIVGLLR